MSYDGLSNLHLMAKAANYNAWMFHTVEPYAGKRILEIGAGIGTFTEFLAAKEYVSATDIDPDCLAELSRRFECMPNIEIHPLDISSRNGETLAEGKAYDTVICLNVLEHIRDDVQALSNIRAIAPEGSLLLVVPALPVLYGVEDRAVGHYRRYTKAEIAEKLHSAGYRTEKLFYFNSLGALFWFLKNRILNSPPTTSRNVAIYDKFFVPVLARIESAISVPFGQSLVAIGKPWSGRPGKN